MVRQEGTSEGSAQMLLERRVSSLARARAGGRGWRGRGTHAYARGSGVLRAKRTQQRAEALKRAAGDESSWASAA